MAGTLDTPPQTTAIAEMLGEVVSVTTEYGLGIIGAIVILAVGWKLASLAQELLKKALSRTDRIDTLLEDFLASLLRYAILAVTLIAVLDQFGVETTSLVAVFGAAGLAIGLALQGTLSHVAAGAMLLLLRPFKVGDYLECNGLNGTVKTMTLFVTRLTTPNNLEIIVPNGEIWGKPITNYSYNTTRRMDLLFGIAYDDDIRHALNVLHQIARDEHRILDDPAPYIHVSELADNSVNLLFRVWCGASDYFVLQCDLLQRVKERFDQEGITIPYPQRVIHGAVPPAGFPGS